MSPTLLSALILPAVATSCLLQTDTLGERGAHVRLGMSEREVVAAIGLIPDLSFRTGTTKKGTWIDTDQTWRDDDFIVFVRYKEDRVVDWKVGPNRSPLKERYKALRLGDTEAEAKRKVGQPDDADSRGTRKQWYYWEGAEPNRRTLEICFVDGRLVSRRFGLNFVVPGRPAPWEKGWTPLSDPPFPAALGH